MKRILILTILTFSDAIASSPALAAADAKAATANKKPALTGSYKDLIKNHRKKFLRLTSLEKSGLHWNQGIIVYISSKDAAEVYKHNHSVFLKQLEADDPNDPEIGAFKAYPVGTILLKENFELEKTHYIDGKGVPKNPIQLTIMIKKESGYDSDNGDWQYVALTGKGEETINGSSKDAPVKAMCQSCHVTMKERDFVFSTFLRSPPKE